MCGVPSPTRPPTESERKSNHYNLYWEYTEEVWTPWTVYTYRWNYFSESIEEWNGLGWCDIGRVLVQREFFNVR